LRGRSPKQSVDKQHVVIASPPAGGEAMTRIKKIIA